MRRHWVDHFMYQTRISMHISARDTRKRLATTAMMLTVIYFAGNLTEIVAIFSLILGSELLAWILVTSMPDRRSEKGLFIAVGFWFLNWISIIPYLAFSILLAQNESIAFVIAGYLWLFGVYVHTSNSFSFLPIYNWSLMIPAFGASFLMFYLSSSHEIDSSPPLEWAIAGVMMIVYIVNTIETMDKQNDTQAALARAQSDANARLDELEYLTRHDKLTGLKNRHAFDEALAHALRNKAELHKTSVYLIDLDDFKPINDSYSHMAGDAVLVAIANCLQRIAGPDAVVARLGGDEFAAIIHDIASDDAALRMASYMIRAINAPVRFDEKQLRVGASIGISRASEKAYSASDLLAGADQAMYRAKGNLGQKAVIYDPSIFPVRATLEDRSALQEAIDVGQIKPYYQPKICLKTGRISGFEALARWDHPSRGILRPSAFLPLVAEFGLHGDLLLKMASQILEDMNRIHHLGCDFGQMSINVPEMTLATVSGRSELAALIAGYPHLRGHLTFEITEDVFIARAGEMIQRSIAFFRKEGVRVSLDDFGTGFASFQHLRELEFDELKLDTTFVQGLGTDPAANVLVESFLAIGKGLGVQVVAEGVETQTQLQLLKSMGCEVVQGHLFGQAVGIGDAITMLQTKQHSLEKWINNAA